MTSNQDASLSAPAATAGRRRRHPAQTLLLFAAAGVIVGSFMPWISITGTTVGGFAGAGLWTFYLGVFGLGGGLIPVRSLAIVQGAVMAAAAIGLTVWQFIHLTSRVGFSGWLPGMGLIIVFVSGLLATLAVKRIALD